VILLGGLFSNPMNEPCPQSTEQTGIKLATMISGGESLLHPIKVGRKRDLFITHDIRKYFYCK
jgi:ABC-type molybdate transport system substrate-binding protein